MTTPLHLSLCSPIPRRAKKSLPSLLQPFLAGNPLFLPAGPLPLGLKIHVSQGLLTQMKAPPSAKTTTSPKPLSAPQTICVSMQHTLCTLPSPPWLMRTPIATPQPTPSPVLPWNPSPPPTPGISPMLS